MPTTSPIGFERPRLAGERVVEPDGHRPASSDAIATRRDRATGTLVAGQVAARRLDVDDARLDPEQSARSPSASRRDDRPAAVGPPRSSGRRSRRPSPPSVTCRMTSASISALAIPAGVDGPAGNRRPRSPAPLAPSNASQTAWRATSPSEWPCSRGAPSMTMPPSASGSPGPNGCWS